MTCMRKFGHSSPFLQACTSGSPAGEAQGTFQENQHVNMQCLRLPPDRVAVVLAAIYRGHDMISRTGGGALVVVNLCDWLVQLPFDGHCKLRPTSVLTDFVIAATYDTLLASGAVVIFNETVPRAKAGVIKLQKIVCTVSAERVLKAALDVAIRSLPRPRLICLAHTRVSVSPHPKLHCSMHVGTYQIKWFRSGSCRAAGS